MNDEDDDGLGCARGLVSAAGFLAAIYALAWMVWRIFS